MRNFFYIITLLIFVTLTAKGQVTDIRWGKVAIKKDNNYKAVESIIFLFLTKDNNYTYGTDEKGKYTITDKLLILKPNGKKERKYSIKISDKYYLELVSNEFDHEVNYYINLPKPSAID